MREEKRLTMRFDRIDAAHKVAVRFVWLTKGADSILEFGKGSLKRAPFVVLPPSVAEQCRFVDIHNDSPATNLHANLDLLDAYTQHKIRENPTVQTHVAPILHKCSTFSDALKKLLGKQ